MEYLEYLRSFIVADNFVIDRIETESIGRDDIQPYVEREIGKFLSFLIKLTKAKKVLELGTGVGNSAIWMGEALKNQGGVLFTVDNHPRTAKEAEKNIKDADLFSVVTMVHGDAENIIDDFLSDTVDRVEFFDIIFQDCGKYLYPILHDKLVSLLCPGGIIIADDTMFSVNSSVRKNLGKYTHQYNEMVFADCRLYSVILPVGGGITLSCKIGD